MTFEIKTIDPALFAELYTAKVTKELDRFIYPTRNWIQDVGQRRWAIDSGRKSCLIRVHMGDRMHSHDSYALVWNNQAVLISQLEYCRYVIVHASEDLQGRMDEAMEMMREALRIGGMRLDGTTDPKSMWAIPHAEFVDQ